MGPASKRRGGSSGEVSSGGVVTSSSRKSSSGGGRVKDKYKSSDGDRSGRHDDGGGGGRNRGGARSRILARASAASSRDRSGASSSAAASDPGAGAAAGAGSSSFPRSSRRAKPLLDPTLLARGMSARSVGARVSNRIRPVAPSDVEKDLRHMEAYSAACTAYAQQFFAYTNRDLVAKGAYGAVPMGPGVAAGSLAGAAANGAAAFADSKHHAAGVAAHYDSVTGRYMTPQPQASQKHAGRAGGGRPLAHGSLPPPHHPPPVSMPVRIDPEEEKRLALLRKRVAASEARREVLETEYLSLRAHYVHESQKLRRMRRAATGQLEILRELARRRGRVVALRRVRCAIARDVIKCLEYRAKSPGGGGCRADRKMGAPDDMEGVEYGDETKDKGAKKGRDSLGSKSSADEGAPNGKDLVEMWSWIEAQLAEAEHSCTTIEIPPDLLFLKQPAGQMADGGAPAAAISGGESASSASPPKNDAAPSSGRRTKSPIRNKPAEGEDGKNNGASKKKSSRDADSGKGAGKSSQSSSKKVVEDGAPGKEKDSGGSKKRKDSTDGGKQQPQKNHENDDVIPWESQFLPRTPGGVPVLLSYLSSVPDRGAGYASGDVMGSSPYQVTWIEPNLPKTFNGSENSASFAEDREELLRLREEVQYLEEELDLEKGNNRELQRQIIEARKRSDGVCAMMCILRTETEAVLNRHNMILDTPEARSLATELHHRALQDEIVDEDEDDLDEEAGVGDDELLSGVADPEGGRRQRTPKGNEEPGAAGEGDADDELSADEPDGGDGGATPVDDDVEESDFDEEQQGVRVKEVIVPISGAAGDAAGAGADGISEGEEGEINEDGEIHVDEGEEGEINDEAAVVVKRGRGDEEGIENTSKRRRV